MRKYKGNYFTEEEIQADQIKSLRRRMALLGLLFLFLILGFLVYEYKFAEKSIFNKGDKFEEYDPNFSIEDNSNVTQSSGSNSESSNEISNSLEIPTSNEVKPSNPTSATVKSNPTTPSNTTKSNTTKSNTTKSNTVKSQSNTVKSNTPTQSNTPAKSNTVVVDTKSFAEDSWDTIAQAAKYNQTSAYKVGDTKSVIVDGKTYTVRVINNSKPSECSSSSFSQTSCGLVMEFVEIIKSEPFDSSNTCAWGSCGIRTYLNNTLYSKLPSDLSKNIISTKVVTGHGTESTSNYVTNDKLFLLSVKEVFGNSPSYDTANSQEAQLEYYRNRGVTTSSYDAALKSYKGKVTSYWLRTAAPNSDNSAAVVDSRKSSLFIQKQSSLGVSPAFKVG